MMLPGIITIVSPIIVGFVMGAEALGAYMAGVTVSGVLWAIFQNNAGGAWDNAKKSFEKGVDIEVNGKIEKFYKKSEPHKAAVVGDTVGDPFKDTSGPSMNILIKLSCLVGLTLAPILGDHAGHKHGEKSMVKEENIMITRDDNGNQTMSMTSSQTAGNTSSVVEVMALPGGEQARVTSTTTVRTADGREEKTTQSEVRNLSPEEKARMNAPAPNK
jgi:K(+)-stimulated pyrophosphate-energized sodium pump